MFAFTGRVVDADCGDGIFKTCMLILNVPHHITPDDDESGRVLVLGAEPPNGADRMILVGDDINILGVFNDITHGMPRFTALNATYADVAGGGE